MKKIITLTFILTVLLSLFGTVNSFAYTTDEDFSFYLIDGKAIIKGCSKAQLESEHLVIPSKVVKRTGVTYTEHTVVEILSCVSRSCKKITIPDTVIKICDSAFSGCDNLTSITIPDSVTSIGDDAFSNCVKLTNISLPENITSIGEDAFYNTGYYNYQRNWDNGILYIDDYLIDVSNELSGACNVKGGTAFISSYAFAGCKNLTSITMPNTIKIIDDYAFYGCTNLTNITIPEDVVNIDDYAFANCTSATEINYNARNCIDISSNAFQNCKLINTISIGENVVNIPSVKLSDGTGVTTLNYNAINCQNFSISSMVDSSLLKKLNIPHGVKNIPDRAFAGCESLTSITIPESVTNIGYDAFYNTGYYNDKNNWVDSVLYIDSYLIDVNTELSGRYSIKQGTYCIAEEAFLACTNLTKVSIPNSVVNIGSSAFHGCKNLTSITIPEGITSIATYTFAYCNSLSSITLPKTLRSVGWSAFLNCPIDTVYFYGTQGLWERISGNDAFENAQINYNSKIIETEKGTLFIVDGILAKYTGFDAIIAIPDGVTGIGDSAFSGYSNLTNITIPDSVTSIGSYAFYGCTGLTSITIPQSVTSIYNNAFSNCTNLATINYNAIDCSMVWEKIFYNCPSITTINIGENVKSFNVHAFDTCKLKSINVDDNNQYYSSDSNGILYNKNKSELIRYPSGNTATNITIPDSVTSIADSAFCGCSSLTSITIPNSVAYIGFDVFYDCTNLTNISVGKNNQYYSSDANGILYNKNKTKLICCPAGTNLTSITIPNTVTSISSDAFNSCINLTDIEIPQSVTSIGNNAFYSCSLDTVIYSGAKEEWQNISMSEGNGSLLNAQITYIGEAFTIVDGVLTKYKGTDTIVTIPNFVTIIGNYAFDGQTRIKSITIPNGVASIEYNAFSGCTALANITMPSSLITIGSNAFSGCTNLTTIAIPNSLVSIGSKAFYGCTKLTNITIPSSVTSIGEKAFYNTGYYKNANNWDNDVLYMNSCLIEAKNTLSNSYNIKQGTGYISDSAFIGCTKLTNITIPNSVKRIGHYAFSGCTALTTITIPEGVTRIDKYAFQNCTSLINISIPNSATSIGYNAFYKTGYYNNANNWDNDVLYIDSYLAKAKNTLSGSYAIKQGTICIGDYAFGNCKSLTDITIPNSIISIGSEAFSSCTGLTNITIPNGVTSIESRAFYGCTGLSSIFIPDSVVFIDDTAFEKSTKVTLRGLSGSYAQSYAKKCNIPFIVVGESKFTAQKNIRNNNIIMTATVPTAYLDNVLYAACYDDDDKLMKLVQKEDYTNGEEVLISNDSNISYIKVFLWESSSNLKPLANAVILDM